MMRQWRIEKPIRLITQGLPLVKTRYIYDKIILKQKNRQNKQENLLSYTICLYYLENDHQ